MRCIAPLFQDYSSIKIEFTLRRRFDADEGEFYFWPRHADQPSETRDARDRRSDPSLAPAPIVRSGCVPHSTKERRMREWILPI